MILYRCDRAKETMEEARVLAEIKHWNSCVNRLYYACFYSVTALLLLNDLSSSKHRGTRSFFNQYFVRTKQIPEELAEIYNDLFERRQEGDYVDMIRFEADEVLPWIRQAEEFINYILNLVNQKLENM